MAKKQLQRTQNLQNKLSTYGIEIDPLLTPQDAADYLSVSVATVYDWLYKGQITAERIGRLRRFRLSVIDSWVSTNRNRR